MKLSGCLLLALFVLSVDAPAQNLDLAGGVAYVSGDGGLAGYSVGGAAYYKRMALAFDYDRGWDNSQLGNFGLTNTGLIVTHSRIQDFLTGPRFYFPGLIKSKQKQIALLTPFAEAEFGVTYLRQALQVPVSGVNQFASDNNFSWLLGGGVDYRFSPHILARLKADLLRTHLTDEGQSRFRLTLQIVYSLKSAEPN